MEAAHLRWIILLLASALLFGNYYAYDNPAALNTHLQLYFQESDDAWTCTLQRVHLHLVLGRNICSINCCRP